MIIRGALEVWLFPLGAKKDLAGKHHDAIIMIHDASRFAEKLSRDTAGIQILRAFGLDALTDPEKFVRWLRLSPLRERSGRAQEEQEEDRQKSQPNDLVDHAWWVMIGSADPIEKLTTPEEMLTPELPETFISFELVSIDQENTPLPRLAKATAFAEEAYETVCRAYKIEGSGTLAVVKVESGSSIRIDCKGLGEPIKHLKDLILEAWHKLRHKRAEEVLVNNEAVLGSLAAIEQINLRVADGSLSPEEAEKLRRTIIASVCGLFECGALIAEIPSQETVENTKLLDGFVPKLLPPPKAGSNAGTKKAARKKTTPKKRSSTRRKT
ncbi:MAG: hypothetical protein IID53_13675 [Proteobacteria bacterium]|nr:hypothetical protein [Pseudomonadota bacterium]